MLFDGTLRNDVCVAHLGVAVHVVCPPMSVSEAFLGDARMVPAIYSNP